VERKLDALPCIAKTREREQHFLFSEPYYSFQRVIIAKESDDTVNGFEDLYYHTVALKENSSHHSYIKSFPAIKISPYPSEEAALKAVADGREKYFVGNLANSSYQIKTNGFTNLKMIQINTEEKQYLHFAARNDWPELVGIVNKGLASITEAEKIEINNRWIGIENKPDYGEIIKIITIITAILLGIFLISLYWIIKLRREVRRESRLKKH
jgi:ABC-type amino acid transport substrate-binding protein